MVVTSACVSPRWKMAEPCVARQHADLAGDRPQLLGVAAVDALALQNQVADDALFQGVEGGRHLLRRVFRLARPRADTRRRCVRCSSLMLVGAFGLAGRLLALAELVAEALAELVDERIGRRRGGQLLRRQARLAAQLLDHVDDGDDVLVAEQDRLEHLLLGHLAGEALDHGDGRARAGHDQVEVALFQLRSASASATNSPSMRPTRTRPVGCRNGICETCRAALAPIMRQHVGIVLAVGGQGAGHDLHFVDVAGGEERADGAIDQAGGEDFLGGGPAFALDEAAGELAGGVGLFAIIDDEGEEIASLVGLAFDGGDQRHGVAVLHDDGAVGLLGQFAGFQNEWIGRRRDVLHD